MSSRVSALFGLVFWFFCGLGAGVDVCFSEVAHAEISTSSAASLKEVSALYSNKQYFKTARYAFNLSQTDPTAKPFAYAWVALGLLKANLPDLAAYFFIRTLQSRNRAAIRSMLPQTELLMSQVGPDLLRKYLSQYTQFEDYDSNNRSVYRYILGKDAILSGDPSRALDHLSQVQRRSSRWPFALQLMGTANAIVGNNDEAIRRFKSCQSELKSDFTRESQDLRARCTAGEARTLYQMGQFVKADLVYDGIPKKSFVWPDILFEQAWNAYAQQQYNRALGKLVSYKSPALQFTFNTEVDVLRAQSFLALCSYSDANEVIEEFNRKYTQVGVEIKDFVEKNANNLKAFYELGKDALHDTLYTSNDFFRLSNQFVRSPYFQGLVANENRLIKQWRVIRQSDLLQDGVSHDPKLGFPGFLAQVIHWRRRTIEMLGGGFVKNSLLDYHAALISDVEKIAFIKLELLKKAKDQLLHKKLASEDRSRGNSEPARRDDQFFWSFNGEFWNDELGDYVFGLESECKS